MNRRKLRAERRAIWECFNGCDCAPDAKRVDRCSLQAIRCVGRAEVVRLRLLEHEAANGYTREELEAGGRS